MGMVIVTGEPRSGTSLTMDTLRLLGVPVWGVEQPVMGRGSRDNALTKKLREEKAAWLNKRFWEVPGVVMRGISPSRLVRQKDAVMSMPLSTDEKTNRIAALNDALGEYVVHQHSAVKVIWTGLPRTDDAILAESKIILVTRHPRHIAESQRHLGSAVGVSVETEEGAAFVSPTGPVSSDRFVAGALRFLRWIRRPKNKALDVLIVDYDDYFDEQCSAVSRISEFLAKPPTAEAQAAAVANIDPSRRRSANAVAPEEVDEWSALEDVYMMLREGEYEAAYAQMEAYVAAKRLDPENVRWLDERSFWPMTPELLRSMQAKPQLVASMQSVRMRRHRDGELCIACSMFSPHGEGYIVITPSDLDDVVRSKIACADMGSVTLEECQQHWTRQRQDRVWLKGHTTRGN